MTKAIDAVRYGLARAVSDPLSKLFYLLYISVAVATFRHSAYGFATLEGGNVWLGALSALAIDAGMILSATGLRYQFSWALVFGLGASALASVYTQLLFSVSTAQEVPIAPGAEWLGGYARYIIDARVLLLPALLPVLSVVYAFSAKRMAAYTEQAAVEALPVEVELEMLASGVRAETDSTEERCRRLWAITSENGYPKLSAREIAALAKAHPQTARKVKPEHLKNAPK